MSQAHSPGQGLITLRASDATRPFAPDPMGKRAAKVIGRVAMWKPMAILLYDWRPIQRRRRVFQRLAARIDVIRTGA